MDEEMMMNENQVVSVEDMIDELYDMLEKGWTLPLSGGKTVVNANEVRQVLADIRESLPTELNEAQDIVADRDKIIAAARRDAESIVRSAEERARAIVNQDELVRQAQLKAQEIMTQAQAKVREMKKASNDYVDDLMKRTDEALSENLAELRKTRQTIKSGQNNQ